MKRVVLFLSSLVFGIAGVAGVAHAYETYSGCTSCHGDYRASGYTSQANGQSWGNSLHNVHRNDMLSGDCDVCHTGSSKTPVYLASSNGGNGLQAISCTGCHVARGLRVHHATSGVTSCAGCHGTETATNEDTLPPYYANPGTGHPSMPTDSCNVGGSEDFAATSDGLDNDGDGLYDGADPDCQAVTPVCGDGTLDAGEVCDDGNTTDGDGCSADCLSDETCGNGVLDTAVGETCDDGNTTDGDGCSASCQTETPSNCGDGTVDAGEECDDGNTVSGDGCSASCQIESSSTCGDGTVDAGEECDDGNTTDGDGCSAQCRLEGASGDDSGCGCHASGLGAGLPLVFLLLLGLAGVLRRRRFPRRR